ncbi:hybrid sensor histidine kinase/response regulator, partial [bacterium]
RIRAVPATRYLPVVMVTSLNGEAERVKALEAGADDFIAKPVDHAEVVARVSSLTRAKRGRDQLNAAYIDLRRSESLRDSLTQMLVHDLRTPLTSLLLSLSMLDDGQTGNLNPTQQHLLNIGRRSGKNLLNLVNDILSVAKLESGQVLVNLFPASIPALVEEALIEVAHMVTDRQATLLREWPQELPLVSVDADLLHRVLVNLISNALKYSPLRSTIEVGAVLLEDSPVGRAIKVWVQDDGPGISPEHHQRIWDKFGQSEMGENNRASTGLGLTFCKLAVEAHGGFIGLDSELGQGSTFHFCLPLQPKAK